MFNRRMNWAQRFIVYYAAAKEIHTNVPIARRSIRAECKQAVVAHPEVIFARCPHPARNTSVSVYIIVITPTGLCSWGIRTSIWHYFEVLAAHAGKSYMFTERTQMVQHLHADATTMLCTNMCQLICCHITRSSILHSLSPSRRILVPVNLYFRRKIRQSSKKPLPTV